MWSDKETSKDLLGFNVHASLIKSVVTNEKNLPITIGLYGDWGSGKSSVLEILKEQLKDDEETVVVYFDGWTFESFDDAKIALIQGIVDELEKNKKFLSKVGDGLSDLKDDFVKLKDSINWMRLLKATAKMVVPTIAAFSTGGASIIPTIALALKDNQNSLNSIIEEGRLEEFLKQNVVKEEEKKYAAVREFRSDFEKLIQKSKQGKVVILIDDLDRCLPRHIIDSLEAIKLFLNVPKTAFVIAADEFIVSNAIKSEYKSLIDASNDGEGNREDLGKSYMEKFIQLPYHLPTLSRKEVETYVTLLFCQEFLDDESFEKVQSDFSKFITENKFEKYGWDNIKHEVLFENLTKEEAEEKEKELIALYDSSNRNFGYNIEKGGKAGDRFTPEIIEKMRKAALGRTVSAETRAKISKAHKGRIFSEETKKKISQAKMGKTVSEETRRKLSEINKGNKMSEESRKKLSNSKKGQKFSEETRKKMSEYAKHRSPEHLRKLSESNTGKKKSLEQKMKAWVPIVQLDKDGNIIKHYGSATQAFEETGIDKRQINNCCKGRQKTAHGFVWKYDTDLRYETEEK